MSCFIESDTVTRLIPRPDAAHLNASEPDNAINHYLRVLEREPKHAGAHLRLGLTLAEIGRFDDAIAHYEQALALRPDYLPAHLSLGRAFQETGHYAAAIRHIDNALRLHAGLADAYAQKGHVLKFIGQGDAACHAYQAAIALASDRPEFFHDIADCKQFTDGDPHLIAMQKLESDAETLSVHGRTTLYFALGKAYGDIGDAERSFAAMTTGNALKRSQIAYDEVITLAVLERIRATFTPALLRAKQGGGDPSRVPIFIVGMPRSGSTLIEQILATHPDVHGAGEIKAFESAVAGLSGPGGAPVGFPEVVPRLDGEQFRQIGARYIAALTTERPHAPHVTDKLLHNFRLLGMIHLALPNARIVHIRRDPVDTCLSCFSKLFARPMPYAYNLGELGRYYRGYARLMTHWRQVLPQGVMLDIDYEDVVADLETSSRRILAHCGLPWDARCLEFHANRRPIRTASALQVRRKLYGDAVGRWRAYAPMSRPLLDALGDDPGVAGPEDVWPISAAAWTLRQQGHMEQAEALYQEIPGLDPGFADTLRDLGLAEKVLGDN